MEELKVTPLIPVVVSGVTAAFYGSDLIVPLFLTRLTGMKKFRKDLVGDYNHAPLLS